MTDFINNINYILKNDYGFEFNIYQDTLQDFIIEHGIPIKKDFLKMIINLLCVSKPSLKNIDVDEFLEKINNLEAINRIME